MNLSEVLHIDAVRFVTGETSKKRIFQSISEQAKALYDLDHSATFAALQERENLGPTGVGRGVAIPHARLDSLHSVVGLFTLLEKSITYDSVDKQPVDLVFTLLVPKDAVGEHLRVLALVSRTLRDERICAKLRSNTDPVTLYAILTEVMATKAA